MLSLLNKYRYSPRTRLVIFILPLGLALGLFLAYPAYSYLKVWRSERLVAKSIDMAEKQNHSGAFFAALSASFLDPNNDYAALNLARKGMEINHPENLRWWLRIVDSPEMTEQDFLDFFETVIALRQDEVATFYLNQYGDRLPESLEAWKIRIELLRRQRRSFDALALVSKLLDSGFDDWYLHNSYVEFSLSTGALGGRGDAIAHLRTLVDRKDESGLKALRLLVRFKEVEDAEMVRLLGLLRVHAERDKKDFLLAYSVEFLRKMQTYEQVKSVILNQFNRNDVEDLKILTTWLFREGNGEECIRLISDVMAKKDRELFLNLLNSKIITGRVTEAFTSTLEAGRENPLSASENLLIRARSLREVGDLEQCRDNLKLAIEVAEPAQFPLIEDELITREETELLVTFYERLTLIPETRISGLSKLLVAHYALGQDEALFQLSRKMEYSDFQTSPTILNFLAYIKILYGHEPEESLQIVERLVAEYPHIVDFRIMLAFAYSKAGEPEFGQALLGLSDSYPNISTRRPLKIALALALESPIQLDKIGVSLENEEQTLLRKERNLLSQAGYSF